MNNLYQWHDEWMSDLEMRQVRQEMEHVRMLREAGILGDSWLVKVARALVNFLASTGRKVLTLRPVKRSPRPSDSKKYA